MKNEDFLTLDNQSEAALLESVLREEGIPHFIRTFADAAYDGIHQIQLGWGRVETPKEYKDRITQLLNELREGNPKE
jgi:hypothetical protein